MSARIAAYSATIELPQSFIESRRTIGSRRPGTPVHDEAIPVGRDITDMLDWPPSEARAETRESAHAGPRSCFVTAYREFPLGFGNNILRVGIICIMASYYIDEKDFDVK